jgi:hypothetical protein
MKEEQGMQRLIYMVDIDEEVYELEGLLDALDATIQESTDCGVIRSRIESSAEICENGEWEDNEDE